MSALICRYFDRSCDLLVAGYARSQTGAVLVGRDVARICIEFMCTPSNATFILNAHNKGKRAMGKVQFVLLQHVALSCGSSIGHMFRCGTIDAFTASKARARGIIKRDVSGYISNVQDEKLRLSLRTCMLILWSASLSRWNTPFVRTQQTMFVQLLMMMKGGLAPLNI